MKYDYEHFLNTDGSYHILRMSDTGSGYIICDKIDNEEDAKFICDKLKN